MNSSLTGKLQMWDGVHTAYLNDLYKASHSDPDFFTDLVEICIHKQDLQKAAVWLIKNHYDEGQALPDLLTEKLLMACGNAERWEVKLHLLQLLPHFKLTDDSILMTEDFARKCLNDSNKFVKAWAYNGLYELIKYIPGLKAEVEFICLKAMETEGAAVKARVKRILLGLDKKRKDFFV